MSEIRKAKGSKDAAPKLQRVRIGGSRYAVVSQGDLCVVFWGTVPCLQFREADTLGRYVVAVTLVELHHLRSAAVAEALGVGRRTMYRLLERHGADGIAGLLGGQGGRQPTKIIGARARRLVELRRCGLSYREAARRVGVSASGAVAALARLAPKEPDECQTAPAGCGQDDQPDRPVATSGIVQACRRTPTCEEQGSSRASIGANVPASAAGSVAMNASAAPAPIVDVDPLNRQMDRFFARLGLLDDAAPLFAPGVVRRGGVLLAVPLLVNSGIFEVAGNVYVSIGPAFYGLRTSILVFEVMALLRIKRAEGLKEVSPRELGRVLGLDRAPEMKTLRGKLDELAARERSLEFGRQLAVRQAKEHAGDLAYLCVDGHVRVYSGQRRLPKAYVVQRRLAMPGTTDYWVNDQRGQPLLVVTAEANEGLSEMLPPVLAEVRTVIRDRRATVVFDRGGWNLKLFKSLISEGNWDILTYRKGWDRRISQRSFRTHTAEVDGREVSYDLAEKEVLIGGVKLRQVTVLTETGHQTHIITSNREAPEAEIACRMFGRWRQENYFKYMEAEFALDALVDYGVEEANPGRSVPNPKRKAIDKELAAARVDLARLEREYGAAAFDNKEDKRRTMRGFKIANGGSIGKPLREAREKVASIVERRKSIPKRVPISEALKDKPYRLRTETKRLSDTFKSVAYRTETALVDLLRPHYRRTEREGRTLIASALQSAAELVPMEGELRVKLAAQSSPHRTRALSGVCEELNKIGACFPGSHLRLAYEVSTAAERPDCE